MPAPTQDLTLGDARRAIAERGFGAAAVEPTASSPERAADERVGIELEWLAVSLDDPTAPAPFDLSRATAESLGPLPGGSRITFEPGGQVELSSPPSPLDDACTLLAADAARLGTALAGAGIGLVALGLEPGPLRPRCVRAPRYDAMEAYFDRSGPDGRRMMRATAGLQVNLDLGAPDDRAARWRRAHDLGPVLAAAFANSPFDGDGPSGARSTRLAVWSRIDRTRTAPVDHGSDRPGADAWADYALAAGVMQVRHPDGHHEPLAGGCSFGDWVDRGNHVGFPTLDDLEYHLTTLFPPVRPRGWLELRMLDAVPDRSWRAAVAVTTALVGDGGDDERVERAAGACRGRWAAASESGLDDPVLGDAAAGCFDAAVDALRTGGVATTTIDAVEEHVDRYVARGRCPADDLLDRYAVDGTTMAPPENAPVGAPR